MQPSSPTRQAREVRPCFRCLSEPFSLIHHPGASRMGSEMCMATRPGGPWNRGAALGRSGGRRNQRRTGSLALLSPAERWRSPGGDGWSHHLKPAEQSPLGVHRTVIRLWASGCFPASCRPGNCTRSRSSKVVTVHFRHRAHHDLRRATVPWWAVAERDARSRRRAWITLFRTWPSHKAVNDGQDGKCEEPDQGSGGARKRLANC